MGKCDIVHTLLMKKTQHKQMEQVLTLNDQIISEASFRTSDHYTPQP